MFKIDYDNTQVPPLEQALDNAYFRLQFRWSHDPMAFNIREYLQSELPPATGGWQQLEK